MAGRHRSTVESLRQLVRVDYHRSRDCEQSAYDASGNRKAYTSNIAGYPTVPETAAACSNAKEMPALLSVSEPWTEWARSVSVVPG